VQDHANYSASSSGFSGGTSGFMPMMGQSASGNESATTKSGVSAGTIDVTNPGAQTQDVATLNRDTLDLTTNGQIDRYGQGA
jgi:filamentous hemagglutinin